APENADLTIDTEHEPPSESADKIRDFLRSKSLV
ncbi:MAG: adenylyl-sulfate kinase, partial [Nitrosopumilus sp. D6]